MARETRPTYNKEATIEFWINLYFYEILCYLVVEHLGQLAENPRLLGGEKISGPDKYRLRLTTFNTESQSKNAEL